MNELTTSIKARIPLSMFDALQKLSGRDCVPVSHLVRTAAEMLRISRNKVKLHLPAVKLSAHGTRYDVADIHALIVSKKENPTWTH